MPAYVILAHKNLDQLVRLVNTLDTGRSAFFVHVDKATDREAWAAEFAALERLPSVRFVKPRRCRWATFGLVEAMLGGIATALDSGVAWQHVMHLSGQDYPIKPVARIEEFLEEHRDESFLTGFPLPRPDWPPHGGLARIQNWHWHIGNRHLHLQTSRLGIKRSVPGGLRPFQGSSYFTLSRESARYVRDFAAENPRFVRFFRHTSFADEGFIQTILLNSPHAAQIVNGNLRYEDWTERGSHPAILRAGDLPDLMASDGLIAKKFDSTVDSEILDLIDREILGRR